MLPNEHKGNLLLISELWNQAQDLDEKYWIEFI